MSAFGWMVEALRRAPSVGDSAAYPTGSVRAAQTSADCGAIIAPVPTRVSTDDGVSANPC